MSGQETEEGVVDIPDDISERTEGASEIHPPEDQQSSPSSPKKTTNPPPMPAQNEGKQGRRTNSLPSHTSPQGSSSNSTFGLVKPKLSAREELLQIRLRKLRAEFYEEVENVEEEDQEAYVNAFLEEAREKIPLYDVARRVFRGLIKEVGDLEETLKAKINLALDTSAVDQERAAMAALVDGSIDQWKDVLRPQLREARDKARSTWYHLNEESEPSYMEAKTKEEDMSTTIARATTALVVAGLRKDPNAAAQSTAAPSKSLLGGSVAKIAGHLFDVTNFVRVKFSGDGEAAEELRAYRRFKLAWNAADQELKKYENVTDDTRLDKLKAAVTGSALELIAGIEAGTEEGYKLALDALNTRWDDAAALAASHLQTLFREEPLKTRSITVKQAFTQLKALIPVLEAENISLFDLLTVALVLPTLPADLQKNWKKDLHQKRQQGGETWKKGEAINVDKFTAWLEAEVIGAPDQEEEKSQESVFLAAGGQVGQPNGEKRVHGCIICGPSANHRTVDCRDVSSVAHADWSLACKRASACFKCFRHYSRGHDCGNTCMECGGPHHHLRCTKGKSTQASTKGGKRPFAGKMGGGQPEKKKPNLGDRMTSLEQAITKMSEAQKSQPSSSAAAEKSSAPKWKRGNNKPKKKEKDDKKKEKE